MTPHEPHVVMQATCGLCAHTWTIATIDHVPGQITQICTDMHCPTCGGQARYTQVITHTHTTMKGSA